MSRRRGYTTAIVFALGVFSGAACDENTQRAIEAAASRAQSTITNLKADHDTRMVNNEMDYGVTVSFTLTNSGDEGFIQVRPWLSCSEGEWSREQNLTFKKGEAMNLTYFFHEPTINASNIQYGVRTKP
jgi:hypothetical protein